MKKYIIPLLAVLTTCICLAACKTNGNEQPENSQNNSSAVVSDVSENKDDTRTDEATDGKVTDENGIIGDGDNKDNAVSDMMDDAVSGAQSIADNAGEGLQSAGEDLKNGVENAADNVRDGVSDLVSDDDDDNDNDNDNDTDNDGDTDNDNDNDNDEESSRNQLTNQ